MNPGPAGAATRREPAQPPHKAAEGSLFCPDCGTRTVIVHTTPQRNYSLRRHECAGCKTRFTTREAILPGSIARVGPLGIAPNSDIAREPWAGRSDQIANWARECLRLGPRGFPGRME